MPPARVRAFRQKKQIMSDSAVSFLPYQDMIPFARGVSPAPHAGPGVFQSSGGPEVAGLWYATELSYPST